MMNKKIVGIFICMLLIFTTSIPTSICEDMSINNNNSISFTVDTSIGDEVEIYEKIDDTSNKILLVNEIIGDRHVKYWEHSINNIYIKGDSILLHNDVETDGIVEYIRYWTDSILIPEIDNIIFEPERDYYWKKAVIFPDEDDCTYFYSFYDPVKYPVFCWEVRYKDGTTALYGIDGNEIGYGIPAPSSLPQRGYTMSGYDHLGPDPDCWREFRNNSHYWFRRCRVNAICEKHPKPCNVSSYISNPDYNYFYELAHGDSYKFQCDKYLSVYTRTQLDEDMMHRGPFELAFIGSCEGMTDTGMFSLSNSFRKGLMKGTVTIGYTGMEHAPGWYLALPWQDLMFHKYFNGEILKKAFDLACMYFPLIAPNVKYVGDTNLYLWDICDVWIKDCDGDTGSIPTHWEGFPCYKNWWNSPDIYIDNSIPPDGIPDPPIVGANNYLYAIARNRGTNIVRGPKFNFYYRASNTGLAFPGIPEATYIGFATNQSHGDLIPHEIHKAYIKWYIPPPPPGRHWCVGVVLDSEDDSTCYEPYFDNNVACKNFFPKSTGPPGLPISNIFEVGNPYNETMEFILIVEDEHEWEYELDPAEPFILEPGDVIEATLTVYPSNDAVHGSSNCFRVEEHSIWREENVGGLSYQFIINNPPDKPEQPDGSTHGNTGEIYSYICSGEDLDTDKIRYYFDWGDGNFILTDFVESGESILASHGWENDGTYLIKVKSIDEYGGQSEWSDPLEVSMPKNKAISTTFFLQRFFHRFPLFEKILNQII